MNQTRNFNEVLQNEDYEYYGLDDLPELFDPENREEVEFDVSEKNESKATNFKKSLLQFENVDNPFYCSVIYGLLYNKLNEIFNIKLSDTEKLLGINLFTDLKKIEKKTMLNHSIFGYFDQCQLINETSEYRFFFRFYERRNKFWCQFKQNLKEKNKMKRELSSCVIQKLMVMS